MLKAYRYKLEPNKSQRYARARTLDVCRELYNLCLYQRKLHPISRYEQSKQLTQLKAEFRSTRTSIPKSCNTSWIDWTRHSRISYARVSGSHETAAKRRNSPANPRRSNVSGC